MKQDSNFSAGLILDFFEVFSPFTGDLGGPQIHTLIQIFNHVRNETDGTCQRKI